MLTWQIKGKSDSFVPGVRPACRTGRSRFSVGGVTIYNSIYEIKGFGTTGRYFK